MKGCAMRPERLTDSGPKGGKAAFAVGKTPNALGAVFVLCTNPRPNCRLERPTCETTALSAATFVRQLLDLMTKHRTYSKARIRAVIR